jgi:formate C-acetyltransferase
MEQRIGGSVANGRMDQYFYPYYKKDIEEGRLTKENAIELFQCLWLCIAQYADLYITPTGTTWSEGYAHFEALTLGGKTRDGRDATNELSYIILKSKKGLPLNYPDLAVRIHSQTPDSFLYQVCEVIKEGEGYPKIFNDEDIVPLYLAKGANLEEANDYCMAGCTEPRLINRETYVNPGAWLNCGAVVEMTLKDGKMEKYGDVQLGMQTGDPGKFLSYDDLWRAFCSQLENLLKHILIQQYIADNLKPQYTAAPLMSMLHDICWITCKDIHTNNIEGGLDFVPIDMVGFGTAIDSLAAVKKLVFDDKKITMDELLKALDNNFRGKENIRQMCLNAPKYGNNDPYADEIGYEVEKVIVSYLHRYKRKGGGQFDIRQVPVTSHIPAGKVVAATPNGRKEKQFLSEGSSASHGSDKKGPTAILLSNAKTKCSSYKERAARLLNIKLSPASVAGEEGTRKLMSFIRSFCDLKLWHIQFNIINRDTLLAAQSDPEKYRNLIVRVAGYSAYFVDLTRELQEEIIARTEHGL